MTQELWLAVLSSSLISGVLGASIAGWFNLRSKTNEYSNAYFKMVLERRLRAYEAVERIIAKLKIAVVDTDGRPCHSLFSKNDDYATVYTTLMEGISESLWLSDDLFTKTRSLNVMFFEHGERTGLIDFGKANYQQIAELRTEIERLHARDMLTLHEVPQFLKSKKHSDSYQIVKAGA